MAVSGNSISGKSFQSFQVNEGLLQKVTEAVEKGEKEAKSSGEVKSFELFYHGFRQNIAIGRIYLVPASVCDKPEEFPVALLYGTIVRVLNLGEETADLITVKSGDAYDESEDAKEHLKSLKEKVFTEDGKSVSLVVFAPAWSGIREYVCFKFTDETERLTTLLRHLVFACYFNPAVSSGFNALMTNVDTSKLNVTDITPKLTYPGLTESPFRAFPELSRVASGKTKRIALTAKTADAIAQSTLEPDELNVFQALEDALGDVLKPETKQPIDVADPGYKTPGADAKVPRADDGMGPEPKAAAKKNPSPAAPPHTVGNPEQLAAAKKVGTERYVVKQGRITVAGPSTLDACIGWVMDRSDHRMANRGEYEIEKVAEIVSRSMPTTPMTPGEISAQEDYVGGMGDAGEAVSELDEIEHRVPKEYDERSRESGEAKTADTADNPANQTKDGDGAMDPKTGKDKPVTAAAKQAEWKGWTENMPVQVVGLHGGMITKDGKGHQEFPNLAAARQAFPDLDPQRNTQRFTWAMRGEINGQPAIRFETWPAEKMYSASAKHKEAYGVHPADCTCGFCEKKGDIADKGEKGEEDKKDDKKEASAKTADMGEGSYDAVKVSFNKSTVMNMPDWAQGKTKDEAHKIADRLNSVNRGSEHTSARWVVVEHGRVQMGEKVTEGGCKTADTADNAANEKGGKDIIHPKTDAEKPNTRGEEPEMAPDKNASAKKALLLLDMLDDDVSECPKCGTPGEEEQILGSPVPSFGWKNPMRRCPSCNHAWDRDAERGKTAARAYNESRPPLSMKEALSLTKDAMEKDPHGISHAASVRKTADAQMKCPMCHGVAHKPRPEDPQYRCQCGWMSARPSRTADDNRLKVAADVIAEEISRSPDGSEDTVSAKSIMASDKREKYLIRLRTAKVREFGDIFAETMDRFSPEKRADQDVAPDIAEAKAGLDHGAKADVSSSPESTQTTDASDLEKQKPSPDAGGVPRLAKDKKKAGSPLLMLLTEGMNEWSRGTPQEKAEIAAKAGIPGAENVPWDSLAIEQKNAIIRVVHKPPQFTASAKKADQSVEPDIAEAKAGLDHEAKSQLADNPDAVKTEDASKFAGKKADQSVEPDIAEAKSKLDHGAKNTLADNPDASKTTDASELEKQACAPLGDDRDETLEMEVGFGDLADLGANLPEITGEEAKAPQQGEGGLNNEPPAKKEAAVRKTASNIWEAELETSRFTFQGYGETRSIALQALRSALATHGKQYELPGNWWKEYTGENFDAVEYKEIVTGMGYRDNDLIKTGSGSYRITAKSKTAVSEEAMDVAQRLIDEEDTYVFDVCDNVGQIFGNVKHMSWLQKAVAEELEANPEDLMYHRNRLRRREQRQQRRKKQPMV